MGVWRIRKWEGLSCSGGQPGTTEGLLRSAAVNVTSISCHEGPGMSGSSKETQGRHRGARKAHWKEDGAERPEMLQEVGGHEGGEVAGADGQKGEAQELLSQSKE